MSILLENYLSTTSLTWANYVTLGIAVVVVCGGAFACVQCSLGNAVLNAMLSCLSILRRVLIALPPIVKEYLPAASEAGVNHYILDIRPEYGVDINQIISDIVDVLNQGSLDYSAPEKTTKYRTPLFKFDVKGWRRTLNERWQKIRRWKTQRKFRKAKRDKAEASYINVCDIEREAHSQRESFKSSNCSNSIESRSEKLILEPQRDEDNDLDMTILPYNCNVKLSLVYREAGAKRILV